MEKMVNLKNVYKNKKVFITGHTGFKGAWLMAWLYKLGALVKGYALRPGSETDLYNLIEGNNLSQSVIADIRDKERLKEELLDFEPDFVFHLAAQPLVRVSYEMPADTFEVNAQGTVHLLDSLRSLKKSCVAVMITTDKVYENLENGHHYKETDRLGGFDPYSASKACAELVIDSYRNSFFNPRKYQEHQKAIASARAGNVIGGGDWAKDRIIPDIIKAVEEGNPVLLRNPLSVRPWQHVLEPLHGYLVLGAHMAGDPVRYASAYNFGPKQGDDFTVEELTKEVIRIWGTGSYNKAELHSTLHEAVLLHLDIRKAKEELLWQPKWNAKESIQKTIIWYKNQSEKKADALNLVYNDIDAYQNG